MDIQVRAYTQADLPALNRIWNEVVEDGVAFPQEEIDELYALLNEMEAKNRRD